MTQPPVNEKKVSDDPDAEAGKTPAKVEESKKESTEETPAEGESTTEETATPAEETKTEETEEKADEGNEPVEPTTAAKLRLRLPENDKVGRLASSYLKRNQDWTMEQALEAARNQLGLNTQKEPEAAKPKSPSDLPDTIEAVDAAVDALEAQKLKAAEDLDLAAITKLDSQLRKLDRQRSLLEKQGEQNERQQAAAYETAFAASEAKAADLYEFATKPDSPGGKRMIEIEESLRDTEDPRYFAPNKPLLIAQMVAAELNIAPKSKKAAPAKPAAAPITPVVKKQVLPPGGSKTVPAAAPQNGEVERFSKIGNMGQLRAEYKRLGLPI